MHSLLPDATTWALALSGGLLLTLMAAATGLPFMALAGQTLATARRRVFYDKCARQLAMLVAVLSPLSLLLTGISVLRAVQMEPDMLAGPYRMPVVALLTLHAGTTLCAVLYFVTWKGLASRLPLLHRLFGLSAGIGGAKTLFVALAIVRALFVAGHPLPATGSALEVMLALLLPAGNALLWPAFGLALCAAAAFGGVYGTQWLVLRRQQDDFGRDHYNFTLPWCAAWGMYGTVVMLAPLGYVLWRALSQVSPTFGVLPPLVPFALCILAPALCLTCSMAVTRSATPMRLKPAITVAVLAAIAGTAGVLSTLLSLSRIG